MSYFWDFPGGPVVKNLSCNAGDSGSIPGRGDEVLHATGQLSLHTATTEPVRVTIRHTTTREKPAGRNERKILHAATETLRGQK